MQEKDIYTCNNNNEAIELIRKKANKGDAVLLKASNGLNFQEIFIAIIGGENE
jgi:UDP-N-acetylmuramyl pentapeptide synthase